MYTYAVIVAGGSGSRIGGPVPKQFLLLKGKTLLWHSVHAFRLAFQDIRIILVLPEDHLQQGEILKQEFPGISIQVTKGGSTRFESVKNGLALIREDAIIMVHDAVRCLVSPALIRHCREEAFSFGNAIPAVFATDTIRIEKNGSNEQIDRDKVRIIQTPQVFRSEVILPAFEQPYKEQFTDEASVVESTGVKIHLVEGEEANIKITRPVDLLIAEQILGFK